MKPIFEITRNATAIDENATLAIKVGERHLAYVLCNVGATELFQLAYYTADEMDASNILAIIESAGIFRNYTRTIICFDYPQAMILPSTDMLDKDPKQLLTELYGINDLWSVRTHYISGWPLRNVYAVPKTVLLPIEQKFAAATQYPVSDTAVRSTGIPGEAALLKADFRTDEFVLTLINGNDLLLVQTFFYAVPADVLYQLLNVCQQYSLSQETVSVVLSGLIEQDSALYRDIYQYFLNVEFKNAAWDVQDAGNEYPSHFFTSLNELVICAS